MPRIWSLDTHLLSSRTEISYKQAFLIEHALQFREKNRSELVHHMGADSCHQLWKSPLLPGKEAAAAWYH